MIDRFGGAFADLIKRITDRGKKVDDPTTLKALDDKIKNDQRPNTPTT